MRGHNASDNTMVKSSNPVRFPVIAPVGDEGTGNHPINPPIQDSYGACLWLPLKDGIMNAM